MFTDDFEEDDILYCEWCGHEYTLDESDASNGELFCSSVCEDECLSEEAENDE